MHTVYIYIYVYIHTVSWTVHTTSVPSYLGNWNEFLCSTHTDTVFKFLKKNNGLLNSVRRLSTHKEVHQSSSVIKPHTGDFASSCVSTIFTNNVCVFFRMAEYPWRFSPLWEEGGRGPPVSGRRCAAGLVCTESSVREVCPEAEKDSWAGSCSLLIRFHSRVPLSKWWDDSESPRPVWVLWGRGDLRAKEVLVRKSVMNATWNSDAVRFWHINWIKMFPHQWRWRAPRGRKTKRCLNSCGEDSERNPWWSRSSHRSCERTAVCGERRHCRRSACSSLDLTCTDSETLERQLQKLQSDRLYLKNIYISFSFFFFKPTCMQVGGWKAQQRPIQAAAPDPLCRSLWILGWFQPIFWSHPRHRSAGRKTAGCHQRPPFLSDCPLSPDTEEQSGRKG